MMTDAAAGNAIQAVSLFSGGLDSLLASRLLTEQGLRVRCLHFYSPFFGKPFMVGHWKEVYDLDIEAIDISEEYIAMLRAGPAHGFGKVMNPCVDCKILMMRAAKRRMGELGAKFIISGEVLGQRPMSQRKDTLNIIQRDGDVRGILLRPLCALHLEPTIAEEEGLVDRSRLLDFWGRGRTRQLELAGKMGIAEIPSPAGGCKLAEKEKARRYWPVLTRLALPTAKDFRLADIGRQGWLRTLWLSIGRNESDNEALALVRQPGDFQVKVLDVPGPTALVRPLVSPESELFREELRKAAAHVASYAPKAVKLSSPVQVRLQSGACSFIETLMPCRCSDFDLPPFEEIRSPLHHYGGSGPVRDDAASSFSSGEVPA